MIGQVGSSPEVDCDKLYGRLREICEGTSGLPETGEGNTREAYLRLWAREQPWKPPEQGATRQNDGPCAHRGPQSRVGECDLCGIKGQPFEVFSCVIHGECSLTRRHSRVKSCAACEDFEACTPGADNV